MIKKTNRGYEVMANSGRCMGIYKDKDSAQARLNQIEKFKEVAKKRLEQYQMARKGKGSKSKKR